MITTNAIDSSPNPQLSIVWKTVTILTFLQYDCLMVNTNSYLILKYIHAP